MRPQFAILFNSYWASGWAFIIPYFVLYLLFWLLGLPILTLRDVFFVLHAVHCLLFLCWIVTNCRELPEKAFAEFCFWGLCFAAFLLPGAYLEYPTDPWEHVRRIHEWSDFHRISENSQANKFAYFVGWTLLNGWKPSLRRIGYDWYGAFWLFLWTYQFYRTALALKFSDRWARVQALCAAATFGTNVFSFRYYALSTTPLAYIAYLCGLQWWVQRSERKKPLTIKLVVFVILILANHRQEAIFLAISFFAVQLASLRWTPQVKKLVFATGIVGLLSVPFSWVFLGKAHYLRSWLVSFPSILPLVSKTPIWDPAYPNLSRLGVFKVWALDRQYFETIAVFGCLSYGCAITLFRTNRLLALLTVLPLGFLLFPPFAVPFSAIAGDANTYRVLYAFPLSFAVVAALRQFFQKLNYSEFAGCSFTLLLVFAISLFPRSPWRGRLYFQFYRVPDSLSLRYLDELGDWFFEKRYLSTSPLLVSDSITDFYLTANFGLLLQTNRLSYQSFGTLIKEQKIFDNFFRLNPVRIVLAADWTKVAPPDKSWVQRLSHHYSPDLADLTRQTTLEFSRQCETLMILGWKKLKAPPFYSVYLAPDLPLDVR